VLINGSAHQVIADVTQLSSLPSASSKTTGSVWTTVTAEHSNSSADAATEKKKKKKTGLLNRKSELDTDAHISSKTDTKKAFDMNENVITSGQARDTVPSHFKSGRKSEKAPLCFVKVSDADTTTASSTVDKTVSSDLSPAQSAVSQSDTSDLGDGTANAISRAGSRVSSASYRQKLGLRAAGRYQSVTSRLYGDNWLGSLSNRASEGSASNKTESAASDAAAVSTSSSEEFQPNLSLTPKTTADNPVSSMSVSSTYSAPTDADGKSTSSSLHFVYSCSTSKRTTVERPSLTSESGDSDVDNSIEVDNDDDDDDGDGDGSGDGRTSDAAGFGQQPKLSDSKLNKDVVKWRQRLAASPPPRRTAHSSRRFEDPDKELNAAGKDVVRSRSLQPSSDKLCLPDATSLEPPRSPESSKHVSFDPFTLSLNAALEGELDVLQSLFSQVALHSSFYFHQPVHLRWWHGVVVNVLVVINEVTLNRAWLVLGWVTVCGRMNHLSM